MLHSQVEFISKKRAAQTSRSRSICRHGCCVCAPVLKLGGIDTSISSSCHAATFARVLIHPLMITSPVSVDIMTQVTNDATVARYAMSCSSSLPCHKCHQSDYASSAARPRPDSSLWPMTAGRLKHIFSNLNVHIRDNKRTMSILSLIRVILPTHSSMVPLPPGAHDAI